MMKTETIFCDICGYHFTGKENWEMKPTSVIFSLSSPPRQLYESEAFDHVCWHCVEAIKYAFNSGVSQRKILRFGRALKKD